jgi:predicted nucleotidyltransferase component of viral defense system
MRWIGGGDMGNRQGLESAQEWLTPLQSSLLARFFATDTGQDFFLTGGTALAAFHLYHRLSLDLDLFTLDDLALQEASVLVPQLAVDLGCRIGRARRTEHFCQFLLEAETGQPLQVDLVRDFGPQYGQRRKEGDIVIDSIENIGANKLTAILSRTEPKDFSDLYFILHAGYDFDDLLAKAQEKDLGLRPFFLAGALRQVRQLRHLPITTPPIASSELQAFFLALADRLLDELRPSEDT